MLGANKTITIFNRYMGTDRREHWAKTIISGASWQYSHSGQTSKEGLKTSENCAVRIPTGASTQGKEFVSPRSFVQRQGAAWTAAPRDKIALGEIWNAPEDDSLPTWLEKNCDAVITISTVADNRGKRLPHIRMGGG